MFKKLCTITVLLAFTKLSVAQQKSKSVVFYDLGNAAFAQKDYKKADSLFTLSINLEPHPDSYFNRAACRRKMNDFKGFCIDIGGAANLRDKEALNLYYRDCVKLDTIVTPIDETNSKSSFKSLEFITTYKYNGNIDYEKYDKDSALVVSYYINNHDTIYKSGYEINLAEFQAEDTLLFDFIKKTRFNGWIKTNNLMGKIMFALIIDENGKVGDIKAIKSINNEAENDLIKELFGLPMAIPAKKSGRNVKSQKIISMIFAKDLMFPSVSDITSKKVAKKNTSLEKSEEIKSNEVMPEFPGGGVEMMKYIQKNIKYPQMAKEAGLSGKCFLKFVISKNGAIKNVDVVKGVPGCIECDIEAIRVVYSMPNWKPAMKDGKPVPVYFNLPINFHLR